MDWDQTLAAIGKLVGKKLPSISGKADLTITSVNENEIFIKTGHGKKKKRRSSELHELVHELAKGKPVHVDSALHGSGSSRNQPETILANLPEVEWLAVEGRKHIVWVGKATHKPGTLKKHE